MLGGGTRGVVGGGVLGVMHAVPARQRGLDVVHLEREAGAARRERAQLRPDLGQRPGAGPELALALRARAGWEELAAMVPAARLPAARVADAGRRRGRARRC